jgi:hypothetical protein
VYIPIMYPESTISQRVIGTQLPRRRPKVRAANVALTDR